MGEGGTGGARVWAAAHRTSAVDACYGQSAGPLTKLEGNTEDCRTMIDLSALLWSFRRTLGTGCCSTMHFVLLLRRAVPGWIGFFGLLALHRGYRLRHTLHGGSIGPLRGLWHQRWRWLVSALGVVVSEAQAGCGVTTVGGADGERTGEWVDGFCSSTLREWYGEAVRTGTGGGLERRGG